MAQPCIARRWAAGVTPTAWATSARLIGSADGEHYQKHDEHFFRYTRHRCRAEQLDRVYFR